MDKYNSPFYMNKRDLLYRVSGEEDFEEIWKMLQFNRREKGVKTAPKKIKKKKNYSSL